MTGLLPEKISANLKVFEPPRSLDDYGHAVIRYENGALGTVTASQISHGRENDVRIEIDGTLASLEWHQENPNQLFIRRMATPIQSIQGIPTPRSQTRQEKLRAGFLLVIQRRFLRHLPTCIGRHSMPWRTELLALQWKRSTRSIPMCVTVLKGCISSRNR